MPALIPHTLLVAPDAFKGTHSATAVAAAIGAGLERGGMAPADLCPVADGGDGTLDILLAALGGRTRGATVCDPLGRPVRARFGLLGDGDVAVVEVAAASGLYRVAPDERDAEAASSFGTGELILAAIEAGANVVLVAAGGSATTDGGAGAIEAIEQGGGLQGASLAVLCDVRTPFEEAAARFGPQKGADAAAVGRLRRRLDRFARRLPRDPRGVPMSGAAGGLSGGLWAAFGARLEAGCPFVLEALNFDERMLRSRAVVVGEGQIDVTTLQGKAAFEIATRARQRGVPSYAIVGRDRLGAFEARIMDLQVVLEAGTIAQLQAAGERLAALV